MARPHNANIAVLKQALGPDLGPNDGLYDTRLQINAAVALPA